MGKKRNRYQFSDGTGIMETEMNTKNNRRRRESVERIEKAFVELLQDRELNELTDCV